METPRRALLGGAASIALAGCLDVGGFDAGGPSTPTPRPDRDDDGMPDHADDYPTDAGRAIRSSRIASSPTLQPDHFSAVALTNSVHAEGKILHYELSVAGETPVDCLVFERDAYGTYVDGARDVPIVEEYSRPNVTETSLTARLDRGHYVFAADYTAQTTETGSEPVDVEYVVDLAEPSQRTA